MNHPDFLEPLLRSPGEGYISAQQGLGQGPALLHPFVVRVGGKARELPSGGPQEVRLRPLGPEVCSPVPVDVKFFRLPTPCVWNRLK